MTAGTPSAGGRDAARPARRVSGVVLDLGNVVLRWDPRAALAGRMDPGRIDDFFADGRFDELNRRLDAGLPWDEARATLHARDREAFDLYRRNFPAALTGPVPGTAGLIDDLLAAGVRLLGLTNWSAETFPHAQPAAPAIGRLEAVVVSGQEGLAKPDPAIFRLLLDRFELDPAATVYADDSAANVEAAARVGLDAVLFTTAEALRSHLRRRGVPVPAA